VSYKFGAIRALVAEVMLTAVRGKRMVALPIREIPLHGRTSGHARRGT
jgi:hypothetical protein